MPAPDPGRLYAFSDGVFAVIITLLILELRPPKGVGFTDLSGLWPSGLSYALSYLFIAIVWTNHHHLLRFAKVATPHLIWGNFAHLFTVSLIPFSTAWLAQSHLAGPSVAAYAGIFFLVNLTYIALCRQTVDRSRAVRADRLAASMRMRSFATLGAFAVAGVVAFRFPIMGMVLICTCLILYLRPGSSIRKAE